MIVFLLKTKIRGEMNSIELNNLDFFFGKEHILKCINLSVPKGSIYGFLGPNGAGKSTTIRILMNLYQAPFDHVQIFDMNYKNDRNAILSKIGAMIESPSLYEHLTAYQNLNITRKLLSLPESDIFRVLKIVKLEHVANKNVSQFSLGMKQRLGIALTLLGDRELLLLDEPINGLDPKGIIEIRELLLTLNREYGKTILISSHILSEIDRIVTDLAIINHGSILFNGTIGDLRKREKTTFHIDVSDSQAAASLLQEFHPTVTNENQLVFEIDSKVDIAKINRLVIENGLELYRATKEEKSLEDIFLTMTDLGDK